MKLFTSCQEAIDACLEKKSFAIAQLSSNEKTLEMHIHDSYEIYISLSGSKHFFINDRNYDVKRGDIFVINQYESHYLIPDNTEVNDRIVLCIHPDFLRSISSSHTDLCQCFNNRDSVMNHRISLDNFQLNYINSMIHKIGMLEGFGMDLIEKTSFIELMVFINKLFLEHHYEGDVYLKYPNNDLVGNILEYINQNLNDSFTIDTMAKELFISSSYACRVFKNETGTTINKYVTARKISLAKSMLAKGCSVKEACEKSGFNDYANFIRVFSKVVGIPPKKYGNLNVI
jgi:AraC-like DNA-binding protein